MENLVNICEMSVNAYFLLRILQEEDVARRRRNRRWWIRPIILKRKEQGHYHNLLREMENRDPDWFFRFTRMDCDQFEWIVAKISSHLEKRYVVREPLPPKMRLFITLRYLATGDSFFTLASSFRVGVSTICGIIPEVCELIWTVLSRYALKPLTTETWLAVSREYERYWNFPHVCGSIDGKHVKIRAPAHSGSLFYCYKGHFSVVLMGVADAHYKFLYVNIGAYGMSSDGGIFSNSELGRRLSSGQMNFPAESPLIEGGEDIPYYLTADEAFGLKEYCMVPYPGRRLTPVRRNFNHRQSRARRVSENMFGVLNARWQIYQRTITASPETVDLIIKATVILHNLLCESSRHTYAPPSFVDREIDGELIPGGWRSESRNSVIEELPRLLSMGSHNYSANSRYVRDYLAEYLKYH